MDQEESNRDSLETRQTNAPIPYISERWWHRLFRVLSLLACLGVLGLVMARSFGTALVRECVYSFQQEYDSYPSLAEIQLVILYFLFGREETPALRAPSRNANGERRQYCGNRDTAREFVNKYMTLNKNATRATKAKTATEKARQEGYSYEELAEFLIENTRIGYKFVARYRAKPLIWGVLIALISGAATLGIILLLFKATLYVVYGHTRIKRE